jgi:hypothetical protein
MKSIKNNQSGFTLMKLVFFVVLIIGSLGWISNIVRLIGCDFQSVGAEIALRIVGIFIAPLGIILGFIGHF